LVPFTGIDIQAECAAGVNVQWGWSKAAAAGVTSRDEKDLLEICVSLRLVLALEGVECLMRKRAASGRPFFPLVLIS
jgi:hypothetical protein